MRFTPLILAAALSGATAPAFAAPLPQSPALNAAQIPRGAIPRQLSPAEREGYRRVFASIRAADWSAAAARLDAMPEGLLHSFARAELYLAKGSPKVELDSLLALIGKASDLTQMSRLAQLAPYSPVGGRRFCSCRSIRQPNTTRATARAISISNVA